VTDDESVLSYSSRNEVAKAARDVFVRLFPTKAAEQDETLEERETESSPSAPKRSKSTELNDFMAHKKLPDAGRSLGGNSSAPAEVLKTIRK
jgi:hypothetical protein